MRIYLALMLLTAAVLFVGCKGEPRPDGMPNLVPCTVVITQNNAPLEGASIELYSKGESCPWPITGKTDAEGKANLVTYGKFQGAPKGTFTVVVEKTAIENEEEYKKAYDENGRPTTNKKFNVLSFVDKKYKTKESSSLEIKIEGKTEQTFDVGAPVKIVVDVLDPHGV